MGIAVFSHAHSIDYGKIGGLESLYRRISGELIHEGHKVEFVMYGASHQKTILTASGITLRYFKSYTEAITYLRNSELSIISNYIKKRHRLHFYLFRTFCNRRILFFRIISGIDNPSKSHTLFCMTWVRRITHLFEIQIVLSESVQEKLSQQGLRTTLCLPPIPNNFFVSTKDRAPQKSIEVTFIGRFDENKGIQSLFDVFEPLTKEIGINLNLSGYFGHGVSARKLVEDFIASNPAVGFSELSWNSWSSQVDLDLMELLKKTDVLILPYKNLKGTMDPPYLVLEGMAAKCVILTTDVGSIQEYLRDANQVLDNSKFVQSAFQTICALRDDRDLLVDVQNRNQRLLGQRTRDLITKKNSEWSNILCKQKK